MSNILNFINPVHLKKYYCSIQKIVMDGGDYLHSNAIRSSFIANHVRRVHFTLPLLDPFLLLMQMKTCKILQYLFPPCPVLQDLCIYF
jgi:hypothetical protein